MTRISVGLAVLLCAAGTRAQAQGSAAAEALFRQGLQEMQAGNYAAGCPKLAESQRLDPRPGTLFTTAECEARGGMLASAVVRYKDYLALFSRMSKQDQSRQRGRDEIAKEQLKKLEPQVPKLTLKLPDDAPSGVRVTRDGIEIAPAALGVPLPVDPGKHSIVVELDGQRREQSTEIAAGAAQTIELELPDTPSKPLAKKTTRARPAEAGPAQADQATASGGTNTLAYVAGGVGIAGLVLGSVTGAMVIGKKGEIDDHCQDTQCDQTGLDAANSAQTLGLVSTIGFGVGAVGLGTAAVLLLTGSSQDSGRPAPTFTAGRRGAQFGVQGVF